MSYQKLHARYICYEPQGIMYKDDLKMYYTIIYYYITLGIEVWSSVNKEFLDRIYIIQNRIIHCIGNSHYLEHTFPIFKRLHILKIKELLKLYVLKQMHIYFKNESPKPICELFTK